MKNTIKFIFDLDGTITKTETLPVIAEHFNIQNKIEELTKETIAGNIPFIESFIRRVHMLSHLPVNEVSNLLAKVELYPQLQEFIQEHQEDCIIATGNLWCWVDKLCEKVACKTYSSTAFVENNNVLKISKIIKKDKIVAKYKSEGYQVVFIGDGNNDMEAMRQADISIASGLLHYPAKSILSIADYSVFSEEALCRLLNQLYLDASPTSVHSNTQNTLAKQASIILSCAGVGSRLGLGQTKVLVNICEKPLIVWQLELLKDIEDLRIVVGYQSNSVISEVLKHRKNVIFVYNHDYFNTKTGTSFYLGSRHANKYVLEWDGDLLVHPEDVKMLLSVNYDFIAYSNICSDEAIYVRTNNQGEVTAFSSDYGDFEWTGPARIQKKKLSYTSNHVYGMLEEHLPMPGIKIRAQYIDTYEDYLCAIEFIKTYLPQTKIVNSQFLLTEETGVREETNQNTNF